MKTIVETFSNNLGPLVKYTVSKWTTEVYAIERFVFETELTEDQRNELSKSGIYLLVSNDQVYIGQAQNIYQRWLQHIKDYLG